MDQPAENRVQGGRVAREQQDVHAPGRSRARAVALHGHDAVQDVQPGAQEAVDVDQHGGEMLGARHLDVVFSLAHPGHAAELVLDGAGDAHEAVGLHLGQADDAVGLQGALGQDQLLGDQGLVEADLHRGGEIGLFHADGACRRRQARFARRRRRGAETRENRRSGRGPRLLAQGAHGFQHGGVGGDVLFRDGADQQVGLEQDLL